jgi:4-amino-4-deoxy-L-arabinose transferase-like glycosyltransferase
MEVPPLLSVFAKATHLLGAGFFWVKFWPSLFGAINLFVVCMMANEMGGKGFAQIVSGLSMITGAYLRVHFLFQPNFLEIFFCTLSAYFLIRHINTKNYKYLYFLAMALALGWLSKYSAAFFIAGIFTGVLLTPHRQLFIEKHLYFAALLALLIIVPNLIWQYNHKWPVIHHMQELRETQLQFISPFDFLKNQVLMHLPCFFVWMGSLIWLLFYEAAKPFKILAFIYITVIVLLLATNGKDYYALPTYPMLFAAGGVWLEQVTLSRYWIRYTAVTVMLLLFIPLIPLLLPVWKPEKLAAYYKKTGFDKTGVLRWEDLKDHPLPQDFADMIGWKAMGDKVSKAYASLPDSGLAGAVIYFGKGLPQVTTDNASFLLWMPEKYDINNLLFVGSRIPQKDDIVFQQFEKYTVMDSVTTPLARENGVKIILYENGNDKVNAMIEAGIKEKKDEFRR